MTTARAGASILRGTKAADNKATEEDKQCQDCGLHKTENEQHLLTECTYEPWKKLREQCRKTIKLAWSKPQWEHYEALGPTTKTLTLLGFPFQKASLRQTPQAWDKRDMAVKEMLQQINTHRMEKLGRASMTGIALHQRPGEEWEIILENEIRQYKEEKEEMTETDRLRKQEEIQEMQQTAEGLQNEERMQVDEQHTIYEEELAERSRYQRQHSHFGEL
jgi:hypothetical protein